MINSPPQLSQLQSGLDSIKILSELNNPSSIKSIEQKIIAFHALNDTEAKKAQEARDLIKKHSDILEETKGIAAGNYQEKKSILTERKNFEDEKSEEYKKIDIAKGTVELRRQEAQFLMDEANSKQNDIALRETELNKAKTLHAENVAKLLQDQKSLSDERKKLESQKQAILDLDRETKAKVDALKKFNF